jgi:hypothetical protein
MEDLNDVKLLISTNGMAMQTSTLKNLNSAKEKAHLLIYDKAKTAAGKRLFSANANEN